MMTTTNGPSMSYAAWCDAIGTSPVHRTHITTVAFGPETYGAWERGVTPDDYLRALPHALCWHCSCAACKTARRTLGRAWS
jgi:hypothetical protein